METEQADSIVKFLALMDELGERQMFRGQGNALWPVIPSLARKVNQFKDCGWAFGEWNEVEEHLLDEFKRLSSPWIAYSPADKLDWLVLAQHHGLPTVLLDMTTNPLKALFFAVENPDHDEFDGVVYGFDPILGWYQSTSHIKDLEEDHICFYPNHINPRLVSQEACFIAFKKPEEMRDFTPLTKIDERNDDPNSWLDEIVIPKSAKPRLRIELAKLGITHQTLFPGLDGIATTIRRNFKWK